MGKVSNKYLVFCIYLVLGSAALAVYWQVRFCDFVNYDDTKYVTENRHVQAGLTRDSVIWAFTANHAANWHPLTWLSHMLDCQLFGTKPAWHHLTNLLFHIANTLLLFAVLKQMTGTLWRSAFVAALFALHPLHVESVAWIAERKDVLSTFFWILTMAAYLRYTNRPNITWYLLTLIIFALGLMTKPMLVTLPFVLLLLDYWPLERLQLRQPFILRRVLEKIPFFILAAVSSVITFLVQRSYGSVMTAENLSLNLRIANAFVSYIRYIAKMIWPSRLAVFYPHPFNKLSVWQTAVAVILLLAVSILIIRHIATRKYLLVGWLWYLGTLVPVIGLIQVGGQALADRYTYVPLVGLFIIIAWGLPDLLAKWKYRKIALGASSAAILLVLSVCTWVQVGCWRNTMTLFEHAFKVTDDNYMAHYCLAHWLLTRGEIDQAIAHNSEALRIYPNFPEAHNSLGAAFNRKGKFDEAISHFNEALRIKPGFAEVYSNLGIVLARQGKFGEAADRFQQALRLDPSCVEAYYNMGVALALQDKPDQALDCYRQAVHFKPDDVESHNNMAAILIKQGKTDEAISHCRQALQFRPNYAQAHNNLGTALSIKGKFDEAVVSFAKALQLKPGWPDPMNNLARLLAAHKQAGFYNPQQAVRLAEEACSLTKFQDPRMLDTLAVAYAAAGNFPKAVAAAEKALELARSYEQQQMAEQIQSHLDLYKEGKPYIETQPK